MTSNVLSLHAYIYYVYFIYIIIEDFDCARLKYYKSVTVYLQLYINFISDGFVFILYI